MGLIDVPKVDKKPKAKEKVRSPISDRWTKWPKETEDSPLGYGFECAPYRGDMAPSRYDHGKPTKSSKLWLAVLWTDDDTHPILRVRGHTLWECARLAEQLVEEELSRIP